MAMEVISFEFEVVPDTTKCKHREGACEKCGTTDRRDVKHTTQKGRGRVAQITQDRKKAKR